MKVKCGNCGKNIVVPDDLVAGQHVRCPYCNEKSKFDVPSRVVLPTAVRPILQHVQPSGRGMESEHEQAAKRSAVEFIEKRIDHNDQVRRAANRKRAWRNLGSIAGGLLLLAAVSYYFTHRNGNASDLDNLKEMVASAIPDAISGANPYVDITKGFSEGELSLWKNAPASVKPKNAPPGAVYHALVPQTGYFTVYELKATAAGKFDVAEIAPSGESNPTTLAAYDKACEGRPHFIAHEGRVYVGGSDNLKAMDTLRHNMLKDK